ncbi:hypothetical protein [Cohnella sp.]|uniref:hypothetical protein n=1 Tax=Cohnella sp. TaxID=1883426 RepID=UPI00356878AB
MRGNRLKFLSLWAINDTLNLVELNEQLDDIRSAGMSGVIFHPRFYPNEPAYMSETYLNIVSELILYAKSVEMEFWIYDENGWPSGTAGGEVLARRPESECQWLEWVPGEGEEGRIVFGSKSAVSSFDRGATDTFLAFTHEGYRKGLTAEAFDYVTGFFADEVAFLDGHGITVKTGAVPWDKRFAKLYHEKYGESIEPLLQLLFTEDEGYERVRVRYWEMLTDALIEGFYEPISTWCATHGKRFTAHLKGEENPFFQLSYSGSCFQVLKGIESPMIDALERYPGNNFYPRILHSVAIQQGRSDCFAEAMGGGGWGVSPESFTNYVMWLAGHGINQFIFHLNQYKLKTQAIQDWPPSMPSHMTWKDAFPALLQSVQEKAALLPDLTGKPQLLIVTPTRGIMAAFNPLDSMQMNEHNGSNVPDSKSGERSSKLLQLVEECHEAGLHYELSEERVIGEDGIITEGKLRIGFREYDCVLMAEGCRWDGGDMVDKLSLAGIKVLSADDWRSAFPERQLSGNEIAEVSSNPEQTEWIVDAPQNNQVFIEFAVTANGCLQAEFPLERPERLEGLSIFLHDPVKEIWINGQLLAIEVKQVVGGFTVPIPDELIQSNTTLQVRVVPLEVGQSCPVAFIQGGFAVKSLSPYVLRDERQWMTKGPFVLLTTMPERLDGTDLISSGFPYAGLPVRAAKTVRIVEGSGSSFIRFTGVIADAVQVWLSGKELGWCWGPDWKLPLPSEMSAGTYKLELLLYPSTFNVYGPHRHVDGDRYLTSPDQYRGVKNFADRPDAPEQTLGKYSHFVKWGIAGDVELVTASI